jgi:hypothetical protein
MATQSKYNPGTGLAKYVMACVASSLNGKREVLDQRDCVCNGTYVGEGCCGAKDGMVWE